MSLHVDPLKWTPTHELPLTVDERGDKEWLEAENRALRQMLRMEVALNEALTQALDDAIKGETQLRQEIQALAEEDWKR